MRKTIALTGAAIILTAAGVLQADAETDRIIRELNGVLSKCETIQNDIFQYQKQQQQQKQRQDQKQLIENNWSFRNREVIQGILPQVPSQQFIPPAKEEASFWNKWALPLKELSGYYTRKQAERGLKKTGVFFSEWITGPLSFLCPIKVDYVPTGFPKTDQIKILVGEYSDEIKKEYVRLRPIAVRTNSKFSIRTMLDAALKLSMDNGADAALLTESNSGLNTVNLGKSLGLPFGIVSADKSGSLSGGVGLSKSTLKKAGEPWLVVIPLQKRE